MVVKDGVEVLALLPQQVQREAAAVAVEVEGLRLC
jgi:hypothetical protein